MNMPHNCGLGARVRLANGHEGRVVSQSTFRNEKGGWMMEVLLDDKTNRVKVYDNEVEILDIGKPTNGAIVHWAPYGEHIPLTCQKCGAHFRTKNIAAGRSIFYGWDFSFEETEKAEACDNANHPIEDLIPNKELYEVSQ